MATELFGRIARSIIRLSPLEAELTKIFANVWRYIQFATANQFFMIATDYGLDFYKIYDALTRDYPRMAGLPKSGFAAGPCLFKDTMQLAAANEQHLRARPRGDADQRGAAQLRRPPPQGAATTWRRCASACSAWPSRATATTRASRSRTSSARSSSTRRPRSSAPTSTSRTPRSCPLDEVIERSDLLIVGAPHREYRALKLPDGKPVIDIWNIYGKGALLA